MVSKEITQEVIDKAIKECYWRKDVGGVSVCKGMLTPCSCVIENGQCDTLIDLFKNDREESNENNQTELRDPDTDI